MVRLRDRIAELRPQIEAAATAHGARDIRVFGSVARGEERPNSDVDFLVTLEPGRPVLDRARVGRQVEGLRGPSVEVMTPDGRRESIRSSAVQESTRV